MTIFRSIVIICLLAIFTYSIGTISQQGFDFLTPYFTHLISGSWTGQIMLDFSMYLLFSALWIAWRGRFEGPAKILAGISLFGGMLFLAPYLAFLAFTSSDVRNLVMGKQAAP